MRIFIALDIAAEIRARIQQFTAELSGLAPDARWVDAESLHVTLKFIGEKPEAEVKKIEAALAGIKRESFQVSFRGCGFFPTPQAARIFWVGVDSQKLARLAKTIEGALANVGIPVEARGFSPHLTLARGGGGSGAPGWHRGDNSNRKFTKLQKRLAESAAPEFGTMTAHEFFLYQSELHPSEAARGGPRYTKVARFHLQSSGTVQ